MKVHEMAFVDVKARSEKELALIKRKIAAEVKRIGTTGGNCNVGEIRWHEEKGVHHVEIENDGRLGDDLSSIIIKSATARLKDVSEYKGDYMWKENHYIRPSSVISFTF